MTPERFIDDIPCFTDDMTGLRHRPDVYLTLIPTWAES